MIYQVVVRGRKLESRDLKKLLARAVAEKRSMDLKLRLFSGVHKTVQTGHAAGCAAAFHSQEVACPL